MCRRTPLSPGRRALSRAQYRCSERRKGPGGRVNALPEGSLCRIRPGQPGSSANLTPTKRGSALRRRSRQDSSQRVIKFQVSAGILPATRMPAGMPALFLGPYS